mmetsp:Transcript_81638/g.221166  ORF Transcript_81638/g.221166 Transcript_81638/m.221166 type:complete len:396 (-) Transcript_81638:111-1298(-)
MLRKPAMERVDGLPGVRADHAGSVGEAPCLRVAHHHVDEVHAPVEEVVLLPLQLEPQRAVHVLRVELLELLPALLVVQVQVAEHAGVAPDLERLVDDVVEPRPEHLRPLGAGGRRPLQGDAHDAWLDACGDAARGGARPEVGVERRLVLPRDLDALLHDFGQGGDRLQVPLLQLHRQVAADEVVLRPRHRLGRRRRAPRDGGLATLHGVRVVSHRRQLPLQLLAGSIEVVFGRPWLLGSRSRHRRHLAEHLRLGEIEGCAERRLGLEHWVVRDAWDDELWVVLAVLEALRLHAHFSWGHARGRRCLHGRRQRAVDGQRLRRRPPPGRGQLAQLRSLALARVALLVVVHHVAVLCDGHGVVLREVPLHFRLPLKVRQRPVAPVVMDNLDHLASHKW